ncbi:MAG: aconitate hydratase [Firmicutes bacterium]|nr:aconitate hydratase [Bacillota bacterium]
MPDSLTVKIIRSHLAAGPEGGQPAAGPAPGREQAPAAPWEPGQEIALRIDQTLTQDATGTLAYLQLEALGIPRVRTRLSVSYVDHNMLQEGFENADDHRFLQSVAARYGIYFSRPGNGICHQVHLERFGVPGQTLLGSDSHTPTAGGLGMLAIGVGGLDVALAMAGQPFYMKMPRLLNIRLLGALPPWVSAKDVILALLRDLTVKGGVGRVLEYSGPGVATLSVPERATIANMGAELGATTSIFPSDERTRQYLEAQGRGEVWQPLAADPGAHYDEVRELDLSKLEPLAAQPHSPDRVAPVREIGPIPVHQVAVGSCTNSSYVDMMRVAAILRGKHVHPQVSLVVTPGSRQVLAMLAQNGALADLVAAGARILESACGPCIGMGQAPPTDGVSLRTFNRNFQGRSGTASAKVYLVSPEVAAASALTGVLTDPRTLGEPVQVPWPERFFVDDGMILPPPDGSKVEIIRGPNIQPLPRRGALEESLRGPVLLKAGDNITTDDILPAGAKILPLRSNIPAISQYVFSRLDPTFAQRAREAGGGFIVGGVNYGQGSSREHAALAPMYLGIKAVLAKSFARIHRSNLINFGIAPLIFAEEDGYDRIQAGDELEIPGLRSALARGSGEQQGAGEDPAARSVPGARAPQGSLSCQVRRNGQVVGEILLRHDLTEREREILLAGGLLNLVGGRAQAEAGAQRKPAGEGLPA